MILTATVTSEKNSPPFESSILIGQNDVAKSSSALRVNPYMLIGQNSAEKFQRTASRHAPRILIGPRDLFTPGVKHMILQKC